MYFQITALLSMLALSQAVSESGNYCVELNEHVSNEKFASDIANAYVSVLSNAYQPQPQLDLPQMEPRLLPLGVRILLPRRVIDLQNVVYLGTINVKVDSIEAVGKGRERILHEDFSVLKESFTADFSIPNTKIRGFLRAVVTNRRCMYSTTVAPGRANVSNSKYTFGKVSVETEPKLNLTHDEERDLVDQFVRTAIDVAKIRFFEALIKSKCY